MHDRCTDCGGVVGHPCPFDEHQLAEETHMPHTCHHPGCAGPGTVHHTLSRGTPLCAAGNCPGAGREVAGLCPENAPGCLYYGGCVRTARTMTAEAWHARHLARYAALPPQAEPYDDSGRDVYGRPVSAVADTGCAVDGCRGPVVYANYSGTRPTSPAPPPTTADESAQEAGSELK